MKHTLSVTVIIVLVFILSQAIGLFVLAHSIVIQKTPGGMTVISYKETIIGERPDIHGPQTIAYILIALGMGTGLILLIMRFGKVILWKMMYFFAVWMTSGITIGVFVEPSIAMLLALVLAVLKVYKPNVWIHNITELLVYSGIAIIFVPLLDVLWAGILLVLISLYDMFAVWRSKHMVSLAEFQTKSRAFAGILFSYRTKVKRRADKILKKYDKSAREMRTAILGGGDIAFPMIFAGTVLDSLLSAGFQKSFAFILSMIVPVAVSVFLLLILVKAKKDKFYPAMPFLTAGCFVGYGTLQLILAVL